MQMHGDIMAADYFMTADLLKSRKVYRPVSEIHGVLCGQICAEADKYDVNLSLEILELPSDVEDVVTNLFKMLAEDIRSQLQSEDFSFQPLLPDDDESFEHRLQALSSWCDGFNAGFAGAWVKEDGDMSTEVREVLSDFPGSLKWMKRTRRVPTAKMKLTLWKSRNMSEWRQSPYICK